MRAQQLIRPAPVATRPLDWAQPADPEPGPGELLIDVAACAVCRTDLQICEGDLAARKLPLIPGHQVVGRVVGLGDGTAGWEIGERIGVGWLGATCGLCRFCTLGQENLCRQARFTGWDFDGGYATRMTARGDFALKLPEARADLDLAPLLCGGVIGNRSLKVCGIRPGGRLGLYGFGASALLAMQVARHWGCDAYVATRAATEQQRALELGAVWVGSYEDQPAEPLDAAITFAPVGDVVVAALRALDRGGVVAINAIHLDRIPEFPYEALWWERQIRSVANSTRADGHEFLALAAEVPVTTVAEPYALSEANRVLQHLAAGEVRGAAVLVTEE